MPGMTIKQFQRTNYFELCKAYNRAQEKPLIDEQPELFIHLSVALHAAKGGKFITQRMCRPCYVRRCGT